MKTKIYLAILLFVFNSNLVYTQSVDIKTAEKVAIQFYFEQHNLFGGNLMHGEIQIMESFSIKEKDEIVLYVFNISPDGFVLVPSEKAIDPILGYSLNGDYNPDKVSLNFLSWLQTYKSRVSQIKENKILADNHFINKWGNLLQNETIIDPISKSAKDVEPLLTSIWNQVFPYNIYCPEDPVGPGGYCYTGPVSVAMGQIMYYWRYPLIGTGSISYYNYPYGTINVNFGETAYGWEGMSDAINNIYPQSTAQLLFHCAASVEADFGTNGSGAYSADVPDALTNFFGYHESCEYLQKSGITLSVWKQLLKDELDDLKPVYYSGQSTEGGHAFVVDGYQESGDDYFHINFGWSGYMNGYYLITDAGGFTTQQAMVRSIFPASDYPYYCQDSDTISFLSGTIEDGSGNNYNYENNANCNWLLSPQGDNDSISGIIINFSRFHTEAINDVVSIYDGPTGSYPLLGSFSGSTVPPQIVTSSNEVLINFSTNGSITEPGWLLTYQSDFPTFCNLSQNYSEPMDTISDGSGQFNYQNSTTCSWQIEPPDINELTLYFTSFETEEENDVIKIYDSYNALLLAEYSGYYSQGNLPPAVTSPSGGMYITFTSDILNNAPGWEGIYQSDSWLPQPAGLIISDSIYTLNIIWNMPDTSGTGLSFLGFNIYRNGAQLNTNLYPDTTFMDIVGPEEWEYCVTAVYEEGESSATCTSIIIPCYGIVDMNITDAITGEGIEGILVAICDTSIISGQNGFATILLPEGICDININTNGYDTFLSSATIICDETTNLDIALVPSLTPPTSFDAEVIDESTVYCTWESIDTTGFTYNLLGYNVFRNDTLLNSNILAGTFYYDFTFYPGNHEYCVTSLYDIAESEKVCEEIFTTGNLDGNVNNIFTNIPVSGAIVSLGIYSDTTDVLGNFFISNILAGSYEIEITAENYDPLPPGSYIEILEGSVTTIEVPLYPLYLHPPINLQFEVVNNGEEIKLFWNPPLSNPWILEGYNIYSRPQGIGDFELINEELVTDTLFVYSESLATNQTEFYASAYYNAGESLSSNIIIVIIPGIEKLSETFVKIYPNPAQERVYIIMSEIIGHNQFTLNLYNSMGENSLTKIINPNGNNLISLDLMNLNKGVYLLNIRSKEFNITEKIIIK